jgi:CheY-like chemotaxis protein
MAVTIGTPEDALRVNRPTAHVLVVDDEAPVRRLMRGVAAAGYHVLDAFSAEEALASVHAQ